MAERFASPRRILAMNEEGGMRVSFGESGIVIYWAVWYAVLMLPKLLYRGHRQVERWEIHEVYPRYKRVLRVYPLLASGLGMLLLLGVAAIWFSTEFADGAVVHFVALAYGLLLLVDAAFPWFTGIRPIPAFHHPRFIIEEGHTWRLKLQLYLAMGYLAVPLGFLLSAAG